jgi:hypothetical protein
VPHSLSGWQLDLPPVILVRCTEPAAWRAGHWHHDHDRRVTSLSPASGPGQVSESRAPLAAWQHHCRAAAGTESDTGMIIDGGRGPDRPRPGHSGCRAPLRPWVTMTVSGESDNTVALRLPTAAPAARRHRAGLRRSRSAQMTRMRA